MGRGIPLKEISLIFACIFRGLVLFGLHVFVLYVSSSSQAKLPSLANEALATLKRNTIEVVPGSRALRAGSTHFGSLWMRVREDGGVFEL